MTIMITVISIAISTPICTAISTATFFKMPLRMQTFIQINI